MYNEIHPAVEAGAVQAKIRARKIRARIRKRATLVFIRRLALLAIAEILFAVLDARGLVAPELSFVLSVTVALLAAVWFGAWLQIRFAEGGLLDASLE
jgi:hypothetical protein